MKFKSIAILLLAVFFTSLLVAPAFAYNKYRPVVQGPNRWTTVAEPTRVDDGCYVADGTCYVVEEKPCWNLVDGTLNFAGEIVDGTMGLVGGTLCAADRTVHGTLNAAGSIFESDCPEACPVLCPTDCPKACPEACPNDKGIIHGTLNAAGSMVDGTMRFAGDTVNGTMDAVFGSEKCCP